MTLHLAGDVSGPARHPAALDADWGPEEQHLFLSGLVDVVARERLEVVHFHYAVPFAFLVRGLQEALGGRAPAVVGTLHGTDVTGYGQDPLIAGRLAGAFERLDALTTVSGNHAMLAAETFGLPAPPPVIPNFVDLARFHPVRSAGDGGRGRPPRIVHVSNFRPVKDPVAAARIFLGIRERTHAKLWLVGDGPEMPAVRRVLEEGNAGRDVVAWGLRRDVSAIVARADVLLVTSRAESFCLAALEAMACGVPVLASRVGGLPELVVDGETGCLFPPGDLASAVELGVRLLLEPAVGRRLGLNATARARRFAAGPVTMRYERLYRQVVGARRVARRAGGLRTGRAVTYR